MFNISKLVNRITDRGNGREGVGESSASFVESEEQHSAEGFLCPPCMKAFPSPEALEAHYNSAHLGNNEGNQSPSDSLSSANGDIQTLRQEIMSLQSCLAEERTASEELKKEVKKMQIGLHAKDEDSISLKSQEKDFESMKSLLTSEVGLLRQQLTDSLEQLSHTKKEKESLVQKLLDLTKNSDKMKTDITSLQAQIAHINSIDDAAVLKQELVSVQRMMDQLSLEKENEIDKLKDSILSLEKALEDSNANASNEEEKQKFAKCTEQIQLLDKQLKEAKEETETLKKCQTAEKADWTMATDSLREKFNDSEQKRQLLEGESKELKEEVKRLQDQHAELYSKIEGGEGAKAALEALQKENSALIENLESAGEKQLELSKNVYNTNKQLEKSQSEHKKLSEAYAAELEEWKAKELFLKDQLSKKDEDTKLAMQKIDELSKLVQTKEMELKKQLKSSEEEKSMFQSKCETSKKEAEGFQQTIKAMQAKIEELESASQNLKEAQHNQEVEFAKHRDETDKEMHLLNSKLEANDKDIAKLTQEKDALNSTKEEQIADLIRLNTEIETLSDSVQKKDVALKELQSSENILSEKLKEKELELQTLSVSLEEIQTAKLSLEEKLSTLRGDHAAAEKAWLAQAESLEKNLKSQVEVARSKSAELEATKQSNRKALDELQAKLEKAAHEQLDGLQKSVEDMKAKYEERDSEIRILQAQTEVVLEDHTELEKRLKSCEEEKSILLEKCLSGENEAENLHQTIKAMQRKLEDSNAALQDLGRENQSLQMEIAKLQGRKWADDSVVTICTTCEKEFTLTIRKHHCRHCGQIFCNDCSSRTASVPSCKKPARVCDACFQELMTK